MHLLKKESRFLNSSPLNPPKVDFFTVSKVFKVKKIKILITNPIICCYEYGRCVGNSPLLESLAVQDYKNKKVQ
jgi:hypothetical protein